MSTLTYQRYELLRTLRNTRFFIFSLGFPLILYYVVAGSNKNDTLNGIPFPVYYMAGMISWGAMAAVVGGGGRIALERAVGWNRQLRLTPLPARTYLQAKVLSGYLVAAASIVLLYAAGISLGVRLPFERWLLLTGLVLVGLVPFAAMGVWLGHLVPPDALGPALGGISALFALLGGAWGPLAAHGLLHTIASDLPSYWLVQAGYSAVTGHVWGVRGWVVVGIWTVVFAALARRAYQRDTGRA
jgi:ABC-2 type transport system permease protein